MVYTVADPGWGGNTVGFTVDKFCGPIYSTFTDLYPVRRSGFWATVCTRTHQEMR